MIYYVGEKNVEYDRFAYSLAENIEVVGSFAEVLTRSEPLDASEIIIVNSDLPSTEALDGASKLLLSRPASKILIARKRVDVDFLSRAIRSGVSDVFNPEDSTTLVQSIQRIRESMTSMQSRSSRNLQRAQGRIVVVFSAKGGCGKTTISINLAEALAENPDLKVCLVDLDLQFGDVAVSLQVEPEKTISSAITMGTRIDALGTRSILTNYKENFDLLLAPTNPTDVEYVSGELVEKILQNLKEEYDYIVIDTPPAFTDFVLKSFELVDLYFLVTTLDLPAIKNLNIVIDTLEALKVKKESGRIIINRADQQTGITKKEVSELLGCEVDYELVGDSKVSLSANQGISMVVGFPKSPFSKVIRKIANEIKYNSSLSFENREPITNRKFFGRRKK